MRLCATKDLRPGMRIARDVCDDRLELLIAAGICLDLRIIERLEEFPGGPEWRFGSTESEQGEMTRLPGEYLIVARKPGD